MTPFQFFALLVVSILGIVALANVKFVQDLITSSGYSPAEVWSGFAAILAIFYSMLLVFTVKTK